MTDVEKYGLFALVFVVVIVTAAWLFEPEDIDPMPGLPGANTSVVLQRPGRAPAEQRRGPALREQAAAEPRAPAADDGKGPVRYTVASLIDEARTFSFDDVPVSYPGERSASRPVSEQGGQQHTIAPNETLSDVSKKYYGTAHKWREILLANPGLEADKLQVGQVIEVPAEPSRGQAASGGRRIYAGRQGDTLSEIAQSELGSVDRTDDLFLANRDVLAKPDQLKVGMHLRIP